MRRVGAIDRPKNIRYISAGFRNTNRCISNIKENMSETDKFHALAKDAGNRLRSYILSVASGATGVFLLALTNSNKGDYSNLEKSLLISALFFFVATVALCLYELRIDAKRFFNLAKELEKPEENRTWDINNKLKTKRFRLIRASYATLTLGVLITSIYLIVRIWVT